MFNIIVSVFFILLFTGMVFLELWIRKNNRYDYFFVIDWKAMEPKHRKKLLNWITTSGVLFALISIVLYPAIFLTQDFYFLTGVSLMLGTGLLYGLTIFIGFLRFTIRW